MAGALQVAAPIGQPAGEPIVMTLPNGVRIMLGDWEDRSLADVAEAATMRCLAGGLFKRDVQ